jgi:hypothetical protein
VFYTLETGMAHRAESTLGNLSAKNFMWLLWLECMSNLYDQSVLPCVI